MANEKVLRTLTIDGTTMYGHLDGTVNLRQAPLPQINPWVDYVPSDLTVTLEKGIYLLRYALDPSPSTDTGVRYLEFALKANTSVVGQIQYTDANAGQHARKNFGTYVELLTPAEMTVHIMTSKVIPAGSSAHLSYLRIF